MGKIIGIDLGTTNSVVAIMEGGEPKVIANEEGSRTTPSVVAYTKDGEIIIGQAAKRQAITNPENTIFSAKRFIGHRFDESKKEIQQHPFNCVQVDGGGIGFKVYNKTVTPPEVSAKVLQKLKRAAEAYLGQAVTEAVITVPAYFNDAQRQATRDAGKIAGLDVKRIVNEPTAAALAYGMDKKTEEKIAVYDLGGGTFDISILEVGQNIVEVISTNGDTHLGGDDFDNTIIQYLIAEFKRESGIDVSKDKMVMQRLKEAAEKAKIELSSVKETEINLPFLTADSSGPKHMTLKLSRFKLEQLLEPAIKMTLEPVKKALSDAKLRPSDIQEVVLVGGSTRIPMVQELVKNYFNKEPNRSVNPDEVVALGAAVQAGVLAGDVKDMLLLDVTPLSLGIETLGGVTTVLIPRNTTIPTKKSEVFSTASDNQTSVEVHCLQGERDMARDNRTLARFQLEGIPPAARGMPQIEVTFDIDSNGIVHVSAKDRATNKEQRVTITSSSGLSDDEVKRMVKDAEVHAEDDKKRRALIEERNKLENTMYSVEKIISENKSKLSASIIEDAEKEIKDARTQLDSQSLEDLKTTYNRITTLSHKLTEEAYKSSSPVDNPQTADNSQTVNNSQTADNEQTVDTSKVVDGEFEQT